MAAKKTSKSKAPTKKPSKAKPAVNKSQFIRDNADKSPGDIVKLAKSKGFDLSIAMVYTILSEFRKKQGKAKAGPKGKPAKTVPAPARTGSLKDAEATFGALILRLGLERSTEIFESTKAKVEQSLK